jgi:hypothetical protein
MNNEDFVKSVVVDNYTEDNQCRYNFERVPNGERLYRVEDGSVCFSCLNKNYGPYCECGNKLISKDAVCASCGPATGNEIFSPADRQMLIDNGFKFEKHPNVPEFATKDAGKSIININDDGSFSGGYDDGNDGPVDDNVKVCKTVKEAIDFLASLS